jgi:hypothetical protein
MLKTAYPRWAQFVVRLSASFMPPQPWKYPMVGYGPSGPLEGVGGRKTFVSIFVPSKVWVAPLQTRTPDAWVVQGASPPKTLVVAAPAAGASASEAKTTAATAAPIVFPNARLIRSLHPKVLGDRSEALDDVRR